MAELEIKIICPKCGGDGVFPNNTMTYEGEVLEPANPRECDRCDGSGRVSRQLIDVDDLIERFGDLENKVNGTISKLDAIDGKMDTLDTHLDTIETKIDALE